MGLIAGDQPQRTLRATAQVHFPYDPNTEVGLDSTNPLPPAPAPNGDGRQTDFVIANLQFKSLQFNSPITLREDANTTVPTPQFTWDQTGHLTNSYAAAFVRSATPTFTIGIYPYTGNATMGFSMNMSESPNTGDAPLILYNATAGAPTAFMPGTAITAQAALYNKVALYTSTITSLNLLVKFTLPNTWGYAQRLQNNTYPSTIYGVLATPTAPMAQPWTALLDSACAWAKGDTVATAATTDLTTAFYNNALYDPSRVWDTDPNTNPETFYLSDFLYGSTSKTWPVAKAWNGQCNDFSDFLVCISNALGSRPLKSQQATGPFNCNPVSYAPNQGNPLQTPTFAYHQFTEDTTIFDSPMRWGGTVQPADEAGPAVGSAYFNGTVNTAGGYTWVPQTPFTPAVANHRP